MKINRTNSRPILFIIESSEASVNPVMGMGSLPHFEEISFTKKYVHNSDYSKQMISKPIIINLLRIVIILEVVFHNVPKNKNGASSAPFPFTDASDQM